MRKSGDLWCITNLYEGYGWIDGIRCSHVVSKPGKKYGYFDTTCTLDIETSGDDNDGYLYSIQFNIGGQNFDFRYIEDLIDFMNRLVKRWRIAYYKRLVLYVHFLGFEHGFITQLLNESWGLEDTLLTKRRKPLYLRFRNGIELRDSFKLFQKSLKAATKGLPHEKLSGNLDFRMWRTPDTPLSPNEFEYVINDVQGLYEAVERLKKDHGYNQATIPLTNTGMVLEEINRYISRSQECRDKIVELELTGYQMALAYKAMAGGDTHGNRKYAGKVICGANSADLKSAHPGQQLLDKFPTGHPYDLPRYLAEDDLRSLIDNGYMWVGFCKLVDFRCLPENPDPTISVSKCERIDTHYGLDNGRLMGAKEAFVYMDSNDYIRFSEGYEYDDFIMIEGFASRLDYLPQAFRMGILEKFKDKEAARKDSVDYIFGKICVNTIFGACAQKTIRDEYTLEFTEEGMEVSSMKWEENLRQKDDSAVFKSQEGKLPYLWGLWTSSSSRMDLWELMKCVGWERCIYWDTDCVKYEGPKRVTEIEAFNAKIRRQCEERGAVVIDRKGQEVYIGTAEDEHPDNEYGYLEFTFLHAKCYAAKVSDGTVESTIAGVGKAEGRKALDGDIRNLRPGLYIADAGGSSMKYVDRPVRTYECFSRNTRVGSYIATSPRTYLVQDGIREFIEEMDLEVISG